MAEATATPEERAARIVDDLLGRIQLWDGRRPVPLGQAVAEIRAAVEAERARWAGDTKRVDWLEQTLLADEGRRTEAAAEVFKTLRRVPHDLRAAIDAAIEAGE